MTSTASMPAWERLGRALARRADSPPDGWTITKSVVPEGWQATWRAGGLYRVITGLNACGDAPAPDEHIELCHDGGCDQRRCLCLPPLAQLVREVCDVSAAEARDMAEDLWPPSSADVARASRDLRALAERHLGEKAIAEGERDAAVAALADALDVLRAAGRLTDMDGPDELKGVIVGLLEDLDVERAPVVEAVEDAPSPLAPTAYLSVPPLRVMTMGDVSLDHDDWTGPAIVLTGSREDVAAWARQGVLNRRLLPVLVAPAAITSKTAETPAKSAAPDPAVESNAEMGGNEPGRHGANGDKPQPEEGGGVPPAPPPSPADIARGSLDVARRPRETGIKRFDAVTNLTVLVDLTPDQFVEAFTDPVDGITDDDQVAILCELVDSMATWWAENEQGAHGLGEDRDAVLEQRRLLREHVARVTADGYVPPRLRREGGRDG